MSNTWLSRRMAAGYSRTEAAAQLDLEPARLAALERGAAPTHKESHAMQELYTPGEPIQDAAENNEEEKSQPIITARIAGSMDMGEGDKEVDLVQASYGLTDRILLLTDAFNSQIALPGVALAPLITLLQGIVEIEASPERQAEMLAGKELELS